MEGIYFYWIFWALWIYTTFLMEKTRKRFFFAIFLLTTIIFSNRVIELFFLKFNITLLLFMVGGYLLLAKKKWLTTIYFICSGIFSTMIYVSFRWFQLYDPVWVMLNSTIKLSVILFLVVVFLIREQVNRMALIFITITQGEFIYSFLIAEFVEEHIIGSLQAYDVAAITIILTIVWNGFEKFVLWLEKVVQRKVTLNSFEG